ncbi:WD40-repeat-containing domain protein [Calycina marina]|uniref:WD40-repeat-containing domain protein n=1 Tax=Calycina marina TaxID=1763456 RepID=A0A9P8CIC8_9HELO|nr:WD40-repeat-containing domain protein [Calycina marina]
MPPGRRLNPPREKFSHHFGGLRNEAYLDPPPRGGIFPELKTIAWNPTGTLIATGASDKTLRVWNPEKHSVRYTTDLKGHTAAIVKVAFNPVKEAELCSVSIDGVVKFWDVKLRKATNNITGLGEAVSMAWCPDGESVVVGSKDNTLHILSPTNSIPLASHKQDMQTQHIAFCWSTKRIFVTTGEGKIRILFYPGFEPAIHIPYDSQKEFMLNGHTSTCTAVELQPTGRYLATGGADSIIALWDTADWICQRTLPHLDGSVLGISFSFDGSYIVGSGDEKEGRKLEIIHTETGDHIHTIQTSAPARIVAWHPLRNVLAYVEQNTLRIIGYDYR